MSKYVIGSGNKNANILIVIDSKLTNGQQKLLDTCLSNAGIDKKEIYITPIIKMNDLKAEDFVDELQGEITSINPNVIVPFGDIALNSICGGGHSTKKYRGSILQDQTKTYKVIPSWHPQECIKKWINTHMLVFDLQRIKKQSLFPDIRKIKRTYIIRPTYEEVHDEIDKLAKGEYLTLDLETFKRSSVIRAVGIGGSISRAMCIPILNRLTPIWHRAEEIEIWKRLIWLLTETKVKIIAQNATFELTQMFPFTGKKMKIWMDTMRCHALLHPELPHGLDFLATMYTDLPYWKCLGPRTKILKADLTWHNIEDIFVGHELIGVDESGDKQHKRRLRRSIVTDKWIVNKPSYELLLSNGQQIITSFEHPWLTKKYKGSSYQWISTQDLKIGSEIGSLIKPWETDMTYEGGWLSGIYDGEGTTNQQTISFSQNEGLVLDKALTILNKLNSEYKIYNKTKDKTIKIVCSSMRDSMRLIGMLRPVRLLKKAHTLWEGRKADSLEHVYLVSKKFIGTQKLVGISTTTKTYIAEGLYTHNCDAKGHDLSVDDESLWNYNCADVCGEHEIAMKLLEELQGV